MNIHFKVVEALPDRLMGRAVVYDNYPSYMSVNIYPAEGASLMLNRWRNTRLVDGAYIGYQRRQLIYEWVSW